MLESLVVPSFWYSAWWSRVLEWETHCGWCLFKWQRNGTIRVLGTLCTQRVVPGCVAHVNPLFFVALMSLYRDRGQLYRLYLLLLNKHCGFNAYSCFWLVAFYLCTPHFCHYCYPSWWCAYHFCSFLFIGVIVLLRLCSISLKQTKKTKTTSRVYHVKLFLHYYSRLKHNNNQHTVLFKTPTPGLLASTRYTFHRASRLQQSQLWANFEWILRKIYSPNEVKPDQAPTLHQHISTALQRVSFCEI